MTSLGPPTSTKPQKRGKWQVALLVGLFLLPPMVAYILFYVDFRPAATNNYGELIQPARPVADIDLQTANGKKFRFKDTQRKWTLVYLDPRKCDAVCDKNLYKIHQIRLAQGKNMDRVRSVYIVPATMGHLDIDKVNELYPGVVVLVAQSGTFENLMAQFQGGPDADAAGAQRIYIVDPIGNIMMRYDAQSDPSGIRKDLKRLLKISQLG